MPTDREYLVKGLGNLIGMGASSDADEAAKAAQRRVFRIQKLTADPAAGDATTNGLCNGTFAVQTSIYRKSKLVAARIIPTTNTATTANASNYATINVTKDNGGGGSQTVILSNTTRPTANSGIGNIPAISAGTYVTVGGIVTTNDAHVCDAGSYLQLQIAKAASGVAVNPFILELDFEEV